MTTHRRSDTGPFSLIPEWVLDLDVPDRGIRLYCVLSRYADKDTGEAWPSRQTLSERLSCSVSSVDRATKELAAAGALTVEHRTSDSGDPTSNLYTILRVPPAGVAASLLPPGGTGEVTGSGTGDVGTRTTRNESQEPSAEAVPDNAPDLLNEWWERNRDEHNYKPTAKSAYVAARGIIRGVLAAGYASAEVREALRRIGPRVFTKKSLTDQCYAIRQEHATQPPPWFQQQEGSGG